MILTAQLPAPFKVKRVYMFPVRRSRSVEAAVLTDGMQSTASTLFNGMWNMAVCWSLVKNCSVSPPFKYRTPFTYPYGSWSVAFALWAPCVPLFPDIRYLKSITNNARAQMATHINRYNAADLSMFMNAMHLVIMCYVTVCRCGGHRLAFSQPSFLVLSVLFLS